MKLPPALRICGIALAGLLAFGPSGVLYAQQEAAARPPLPKARPRSDRLGVDYPPALRREGKSGRVKVEFGIDDKGFITNPIYEIAGDEGFRKPVEAIMKGTSFDVPENWTALGGPAARYVFTFIYAIDLTGRGCEYPPAEVPIVTCAQLSRR